MKTPEDEASPERPQDEDTPQPTTAQKKLAELAKAYRKGGKDALREKYRQLNPPPELNPPPQK